MRTPRFILLLSILPLTSFAQETPEEEQQPPPSVEEQPTEEYCCEPLPRWYFEVKPGYYYFTDELMRKFFDKGGFTIRGEFGYKFWGPLTVWVDGGYFQKEGYALGGTEELRIKLATLTLGLKAIFEFNNTFAFYAGAGPRLYMMMLHNETPFIRSEDNQLGIGAGFDGGFLIFPFSSCQNIVRNIFLDFFADYSWKKLRTEEDELSSEDFDVDVSGITAGAGLGIRF